MQYPFVSLVIPCFEEKDRVDIMLREIDRFKQSWPAPIEVIVVDDGSSDHTSDLIQAHPLFPASDLTLIKQQNTGKGGALKTGVAAARGEFILTLDADMATSPSQLKEWLEEKKVFSDHDILIGSREMNKTLVKDKKHREFIGHVFNFIIRRISGLNIQDTQCGFKLYPSAIGKELFADLQTLGWAHDVELLVKARKKNYTVVEMPVRWTAVAGSKIRIVRDSWRMFWEVVRIGK